MPSDEPNYHFTLGEDGEIFVNPSAFTWDTVPSDPLGDLYNAMRIVTGEEPYAGQRLPADDGTYVITNVK